MEKDLQDLLKELDTTTVVHLRQHQRASNLRVARYDTKPCPKAIANFNSLPRPLRPPGK